MQDINVRGSFLLTKACLPYLMKAANPHVLMLSPPLNFDPKWLGPHIANTVAKYSMSMWVLGMAEEFRDQRVAFNGLWPRTYVATVAVRNVLGGDCLSRPLAPAGDHGGRGARDPASVPRTSAPATCSSMTTCSGPRGSPTSRATAMRPRARRT